MRPDEKYRGLMISEMDFTECGGEIKYSIMAENMSHGEEGRWCHPLNDECHNAFYTVEEAKVYIDDYFKNGGVIPSVSNREVL